MNKRKITNPYKVKFEPFDNYGAPVPGMSWHKISYNGETGQGSYILKMEPGAKSLPHKHINYEEFLMLDGELIDPDDKVFKKGDFITFAKTWEIWCYYSKIIFKKINLRFPHS